MNSAVDYNLKDIDRREKHLWMLAFALIFVLAVVTVGTYFFLVDEAFQDFSILRTMANRALGGLGVLIVLFCAYVVHTRTTFGKMRELLERKANHDDLTDLYNRRYFEYRLEEEMARANQRKDTFVLLLCDLDGFKAINDSWGHQAGDEALKAVAQCIKESTRGTDFVARWGGDEMIAFVSNTGREGGLITAERIRKSVRKVREKYDLDLDLDLSIGVALYPEHGKNPHELLRLSDKALYIAKKGGDKIHVGEEEYRLDEQSVKIVFQPVVDVRTNRTLGYEALGRDPQGKVSILELFKRYQVIGQLTELKCLAFRLELEKAQKAGIEKLFANVDMNMLRNLEPIYKPSGMDVILEISERDAMDDVGYYLKITKEWRDRGFKFAIDDFGSGFISLPFIAQLIPDYIKLDRSTVLQAVSSGEFREFLKDLILALRNYSAEGIIAEGIETEEELQVAKELGSDLIQGFLVGRPGEYGIT